jgi:replicative DNA helicase Mcm
MNFRQIIEDYSDLEEEKLILDINEIMSVEGEDVAKSICDSPSEFIKEARIFFEEHGINYPEIRIYNSIYPKLSVLNIGPEYLYKLVTIEGLVRGLGSVAAKIRKAVYVCDKCENTREIEVNDKFEKSFKCICEMGRMELREDKSLWVKYQRGELQDQKDLNSKLEIILEDSLVKTINPGDSVILTGILKIKPVKKSYVSQYYLEVTAIEKVKKSVEEIHLTPKDLRKIREIAKSNPLKIFKESLAPGIYGLDHIKEAIVLQLFGGCEKISGPNKIRGNIHILLIGDPGTAKSQLLVAAKEISPLGLYVCGKTSTGVGLTATVEKSTEGEWMVRAGAVVLASGGICCIDEFEKMDKKEKQVLLEAMEQQSVSIAKASIVASLPAKTSILAAANPKFGRFDPTEKVINQIDIDPPMLSRFDLVFVIKDIPGDIDELIADRILACEHEPEIDYDIFRKYIAYAKKINPKLTEEAKQRLKSYYISLRSKSKDVIHITARELASLIRLAEAHARIHLRDKVLVEDVEKAISLKESSIKEICGEQMDVDIIHTGVSSKERSELKKIEEAMRSLGTFSPEQIAEMTGADLFKINDYIEKLMREGIIYKCDTNKYKWIT